MLIPVPFDLSSFIEALSKFVEVLSKVPPDRQPFVGAIVVIMLALWAWTRKRK